MTQGVPPRVAIQVLGHSQISLALGTYSHSSRSWLYAADRMSAALWGPEATTLAPGTRRRRAWSS